MPSDDIEPALFQAISKTTFALLDERKPGATVCPSEVARAMAAEEENWRPLMPSIRQVAQALAKEGRLIVTRGGHPVDATVTGGPIRLGKPG